MSLLDEFKAAIASHQSEIADLEKKAEAAGLAEGIKLISTDLLPIINQALEGSGFQLTYTEPPVQG